eukprot:scaffold105400_cov30-Tisochrysis_lutea.AAC.1
MMQTKAERDLAGPIAGQAHRRAQRIFRELLQDWLCPKDGDRTRTFQLGLEGDATRSLLSKGDAQLVVLLEGAFELRLQRRECHPGRAGRCRFRRILVNNEVVENGRGERGSVPVARGG